MSLKTGISLSKAPSKRSPSLAGHSAASLPQTNSMAVITGRTVWLEKWKIKNPVWTILFEDAGRNFNIENFKFSDSDEDFFENYVDELEDMSEDEIETQSKESSYEKNGTDSGIVFVFIPFHVYDGIRFPVAGEGDGRG
ncbi:hypothetical protein DFH06DRAFT_1138503 [Mycena polygramma]|nr:hypothetical protein DFH06DRAFT_1138503 [Mycena polygramma]